MGEAKHEPDQQAEAELRQRWKAVVTAVHREHAGEAVSTVRRALDQGFRLDGMTLSRQALDAIALPISQGHLPLG